MICFSKLTMLKLHFHSKISAAVYYQLPFLFHILPSSSNNINPTSKFPLTSVNHHNNWGVMECKIKFVRSQIDDFEEFFGQMNPACLTSPQKDLIRTLQKELRCLKIFLWYSEKLSYVFEDDELPSATKAIEAVDRLANMLRNNEESESEEMKNQNLEDVLLECALMRVKEFQYSEPLLEVVDCLFAGLEDIVDGLADILDDDEDSETEEMADEHFALQAFDDEEESETEEMETQDDEHSVLQALEMFLKKLQDLKPVLKEAFLDLSDLLLKSKYFRRHDWKELLEIAVKNLRDLLVLKPNMMASTKRQIGAVEKRLECVSAVFHFASRDEHVDQLNSFFNHLQDWANTAAAVPFLYLVNETDERMNTIVSLLIEKFKPCTPQIAELYLGALKAIRPSQEPDSSLKQIAVACFLEILLENNILPTDDAFEMLQHGLTFLISFLLNPPRQHAEERKSISTQRNACVDEVASFICSLYASNLKEDAPKRSILLHDLQEMINQAKAEIRELQLQVPASLWNNSPRTNVQGLLEIFFEDLNEKLKYETLTTYQRHQVMTIKRLLTEVYELPEENEELKDLRTRINGMAYSAEYVIDCCFLFYPVDYWRNAMDLSDVIEEIQFIRTEMNESRHDQMCNSRVLGDEMKSGGVLSPQANNTTMDDVMVGFTEEKENIITCLTGGLPQRDIVAIVGMTGQGKTTLARKVYHEPHVRLHFQKYAWYCVSQVYKIKDMFINILKQVNPTVRKGDVSQKSHEDLAEDISHKSREDLAEELYRCLKGNRYLIVLDDIWDIGAWKELKASFPDDENGSRIMFTSRIHRVALEAKCDCNLLELYPLSFEDSSKLLQLKLSYGDGFPIHLGRFAKHISENCGGLPLAIVVIAGLLAKANGNLASWKQVAGSLNSQFAREGCMEILELSYQNLPDYLKPCFLYLAAYPEDLQISAKTLTRHWIAEGFIRKHEKRSLEEVANEYLKDLVDRSLLFVAKRSSRFGIKRCIVHDLVRELCLQRAKEENFLLTVSDLSNNHSVGTMQHSYRLCLHMNDYPSFPQFEPAASRVHTLLCFESVVIPKASFSFIRFKFIRVLLLPCEGRSYEIDGITQLVYLRHLTLSGTFRIESSIANLSRLEFLMLKVEDSFPRTILSMRSLRYLYLSGMFEGTDDSIDMSLPVDNLETFLSNYTIYSEKEFIWQLRRMPNVQKLGVSLNFCIPLSIFLSKLESLSLGFCRKVSAPELDLPSTLTKLTMGGLTLSASSISTMGKLPNLEVLKLLYADFEDQRWDVEDEEFLKLKYLNLRWSDIEQWDVSTDSFPQLQQLILKHCFDLTEIPLRFGVLPTLKVLKVIQCKKVADSVREIIAEQEDLGDVGLQITTDFPDEV